MDLLEELNLIQCAVFVTKATTDEEEVVWNIRSLRGKKMEYRSLLLVRKPLEVPGTK